MSEERVNPESQKNKNWNLKALATNPDRIYEKKLKLEGTQIELIHKYINPLLNRVQTITDTQTQQHYPKSKTKHKTRRMTYTDNWGHEGGGELREAERTTTELGLFQKKKSGSD